MKINERKNLLKKYALQQIKEFELTEPEQRILTDFFNEIIENSVNQFMVEQTEWAKNEANKFADKLEENANVSNISEIESSSDMPEEMMLPKAASKKEE